MVRGAVRACAVLALLASQVPVLAEPSSSVPKSMAPVTSPTTSKNGISACVEFGGCTSGSNTFKTESQPSPIKSPASHSVPDITGSAASQSYVSSLAAAGGSDAYAQSPYHGPTTKAPPPTTVEVPTVTTENDHPVTTTVVNPDNAGALSNTIPTFLVVVAALGGGAVLL